MEHHSLSLQAGGEPYRPNLPTATQQERRRVSQYEGVSHEAEANQIRKQVPEDEHQKGDAVNRPTSWWSPNHQE